MTVPEAGPVTLTIMPMATAASPRLLTRIRPSSPVTATDPFGNLISSSGSLAGPSVYRAFSKEFHANSGLYYYGFRFYDPNLQRWLNQDPILEGGGGRHRARQFNVASFPGGRTAEWAACRKSSSQQDFNMNGNRIIPEHLQEKVNAMPESSYGVTRIRITLDDGSKFNDV